MRTKNKTCKRRRKYCILSWSHVTIQSRRPGNETSGDSNGQGYRGTRHPVTVNADGIPGNETSGQNKSRCTLTKKYFSLTTHKPGERDIRQENRGKGFHKKQGLSWNSEKSTSIVPNDRREDSSGQPRKKLIKATWRTLRHTEKNSVYNPQARTKTEKKRKGLKNENIWKS